MGVNEKNVSYIIENNALDNVICRALELRPTEYNGSVVKTKN